MRPGRIFELQDVLYFALGDCEKHLLHQIVSGICEVSGDKKDQKLYVCVGSNEDGLAKLSENYKRISLMFPICEAHGEEVLFYDELGIKRFYCQLVTWSRFGVTNMKCLDDWKNMTMEMALIFWKYLRCIWIVTAVCGAWQNRLYAPQYRELPD